MKNNIQKRKLLLNNIILDIDYDYKNPDNIEAYQAGIVLSYSEMEEKNIKISFLKRVLVSIENQNLGFVFEYIDKNDLAHKDLLISKKIPQDQIRKLSKCKNAVIMLLEDNNGFPRDGIFTQIISK